MKNKHWQYITLLLIFTVLLDFAFGKLYEGLYFSEKSRQNDRFIYSVLGTSEDILIFGSSRALHHYNPIILEDSLGMSCYNVGSGGQNIYFHLALLEATLERYKPRIVILELMSIDFEVTSPQWDTEKLVSLLPFFYQSNAARCAVLRRGNIERLKTISFIYPFNSTQYTSLRNNSLPYNNHIKGFIPIDRVWSEKLEKIKVSESVMDNNKFEALLQFIENCQANEIRLFIFISPHYAYFVGSSRYAQLNELLCSKTGLNVQSFENDHYFLNNPDLFADPFHLNKNGTDQYSIIVSSILKSGIFY